MALDQLTKAWVRRRYAVGDSEAVLGGFFHITHVENPGAAFGLFPNQTAFFIVVTAVVLVLTFAYRGHIARERPLLKVGYALGIAGAIGNLIDRIRFGVVTDFIDFGFFPVFNVADSAIVVGVALLLWGIVREDRLRESVKNDD